MSWFVTNLEWKDEKIPHHLAGATSLGNLQNR